MKILFITHYYEPDSGAAAVRLTRLARLLQARGHEVTVLTTMPHYPQGRIAEGYRGKFSTDEKRDGLRVVQVWLWATPSNSIVKRLISQISFMLTCMLRGLFLPRPDVIFIENQPIFTGLAGWFLSRVKRRPYLLNVSDFWPEQLIEAGVMSEKHSLYRLFKGLVNRTQRDAGALVALLPGIRDSIEARLGAQHSAHVIFNAVDLERFRPGLDDQRFRATYQLGDEKLISFIGSFSVNHDFDAMLRVAEYFNDREDLRFVFIGTGTQRAIVEQYQRSAALSRLRWIGWVDHADMPSAWAASYATYWMTQPHQINRLAFHAKLFEAMASGVPALIAVEGLMAEILAASGAGVTVPFGDEAGMIAVIDDLVTHPEKRTQMSANARAYAEENFDAQRVADAYEVLLRGIAEAQH